MAADSGKAKGTSFDRFAEAYGKGQSEAELLMEREIIGANVGCRGYTTLAQADELGEHLRLRPGARLLDIGAGRGWPGLYLARKTGCEVVLTDPAAPGLRVSLRNADEWGHRSSAAVASAASLPFRREAFDAIVHTDVL